MEGWERLAAAATGARLNDRLGWLNHFATRWARNALATGLLPCMQWLWCTDRAPGLLVSAGMLVLLLLTLAIRAGRVARID